MNRRVCWLLALSAGAALAAGAATAKAEQPAAAAADKPADAEPRFTFFAMDTAVGQGSPADIAQRLAEAGYDGLGWVPNRLPEMVEACAQHKLRLVAVYAGLGLEDENVDGLRQTIGQLQGTGAIVWLPIGSRRFERSSPAGDATAVAKVRPLAEAAQAAGVKIAFYPHTGMWLERVEDAVRLAKQVDRPNVGATFNLCHFLRVDKADNLAAAVRAALPHLFVVTINGADTDGKDWNTLIQTLDRGSFDNAALLKLLVEAGYRGPIGFQGYGIGGDPADNLRRTMTAWRKLNEPAAR